MKVIPVLFIVLLIPFCLSYAKDQAHKPGSLLFMDPLDGTKQGGRRVRPESFVEHPEHGTVYLLEVTKPDSLVAQPWVGDSTWTSYRIEAELFFLEGGRGFICFSAK